MGFVGISILPALHVGQLLVSGERMVFSWGEPKRAPHRRAVHEPCLSILVLGQHITKSTYINMAPQGGQYARIKPRDDHAGYCIL